ncbi:MAG: hypothetical protein HFH61_03355 [Lachnospiraceae bacterium]|nr:hypothetical protein [Lachnospiraceae bacterium]
MAGETYGYIRVYRKGLNRNNASGHTGVYLDGRQGKWIAQIGFKGKTYYLGSYADKREAVKARQKGEEMHKDFIKWYYAQHPSGHRLEEKFCGSREDG